MPILRYLNVWLKIESQSQHYKALAVNKKKVRKKRKKDIPPIKASTLFELIFRECVWTGHYFLAVTKTFLVTTAECQSTLSGL